MLGQYFWYGYDLTPATRAKHIKDAGFDATMIWWGDEFAHREGSKAQLVQIVRDAGLIIENMHVSYAYCNDFWSESIDKREAVLSLHYEWLDDCAKFDIPMLVMHLTKGSSIKEVNSRGLKCLENLVLRAESLGIRIAAENTRVNSVIEKTLEELPSQHLGFCYDSSHDKLYGQVEFEILKTCGSRLIATHLSDNDGIEDRHWLPGRGVVNWNKFFEVLPKDYEGYISLEAFGGTEDCSPEAYLGQALQKARWIEGNLCLAKNGT